jgi:ribosomal protein S18 acetylase RimI-like enzyme
VITRLTSVPAVELADLLADAVEGGASVGFLASPDHAGLVAWWKALAPAVEDGTLLLWAARADDRIVGTVQVRLTSLPNGKHRAELAKLLVHRSARGRGIGRELMRTAERGAAALGITLLVLDTETDSPAEGMYVSLGWTKVGVVPDFALDPGGVMRPTTVFYKAIADAR